MKETVFLLFLLAFLQAYGYAGLCPLSGDYPPCGTISLGEVTDMINGWAFGTASLSDVILMINAWAAPQTASEKQVVELFVMSYCPYGLQMEKGLIPVLDALNDSVVFSVRFCSYAMHGKKEIDEQLLQHCIQEERPDSFIPYLRCFLEEGNSSGCLNRTGLAGSELAGCISSTDAGYNVSGGYYDRSAWLYGRYPPFAVDSALNSIYGIYASPTLVVGSSVVSTGRDPKSLLETICSAYSQKPSACSADLPDETPAPGFGYDGTGSGSGSC